MDPRNLIFGQKPEIGNPIHIEQYKLRAARNAGELPLILKRSYYDYEMEEEVDVWFCPQCGGEVISDGEETFPCPNSRCMKEFELREYKDGVEVYVVKKEPDTRQ